MYIIMVGAPGTGKGTIGIGICKEFGLKHVATGDIFRDEIKRETKLGLEAHKFMSNGKLVPDYITNKLVEENLDKYPDALLDGYPRTVEQAKSLKRYLKSKGKNITVVIDLNVSDEDLIYRTSKREVCTVKECGASYNTEFLKPKVPGICDKCGAPLTHREDDYPEVIQARLDVYHSETEPLIDFYKEEGVLESIDIDIYNPNTKEITSQKSFDIINKRK